MFVVCCVGSGVCDRLVTRSEEYYRVRMRACVCPIVHDLETPKTRRLHPIRAVTPSKEKSIDSFLSCTLSFQLIIIMDINCSAKFRGGNNTSAIHCMVYCTAMGT